MDSGLERNVSSRLGSEGLKAPTLWQLRNVSVIQVSTGPAPRGRPTTWRDVGQKWRHTPTRPHRRPDRVRSSSGLRRPRGSLVSGPTHRGGPRGLRDTGEGVLGVSGIRGRGRRFALPAPAHIHPVAKHAQRYRGGGGHVRRRPAQGSCVSDGQPGGSGTVPG